MQTPSISTSSEILLDFFGLYLYARLLADKAVSYLAALFDAAQSALRAANDTERAANRTLRVAQAKLDYSDFELDRVVRAFEGAVLNFVDKQRGHFEYKRFFPKGLRAVTDVAPEKELAAVRRIETELANGTTFPEAAKWLATIHEHRVGCDAAKAERDAAETAYEDAFRAEMAARNDWQATYRETYGKLIEAFPQDRKRIDSYFASKSSAKGEHPGLALVEATPPGEVAPPKSADALVT